SSESSDEHRNSLIETEPLQMDTILLLVKNDAYQNISNKSDFEDHEDVSFNTFHKSETH
ncbi:18124_t:CDS:2, partial [Gigaspora rosea]